MIVMIIGKDPDDGKNWQQNEKGATEDEIVRQHQLNGHEFEPAPKIEDKEYAMLSTSDTKSGEDNP